MGLLKGEYCVNVDASTLVPPVAEEYEACFSLHQTEKSLIEMVGQIADSSKTIDRILMQVNKNRQQQTGTTTMTLTTTTTTTTIIRIKIIIIIMMIVVMMSRPTDTVPAAGTRISR